MTTPPGWTELGLAPQTVLPTQTRCPLCRKYTLAVYHDPPGLWTYCGHCRAAGPPGAIRTIPYGAAGTFWWGLCEAVCSDEAVHAVRDACGLAGCPLDAAVAAGWFAVLRNNTDRTWRRAVCGPKWKPAVVLPIEDLPGRVEALACYRGPDDVVYREASPSGFWNLSSAGRCAPGHPIFVLDDPLTAAQLAVRARRDPKPVPPLVAPLRLTRDVLARASGCWRGPVIGWTLTMNAEVLATVIAAGGRLRLTGLPACRVRPGSTPWTVCKTLAALAKPWPVVLRAWIRRASALEGRGVLLALDHLGIPIDDLLAVLGGDYWRRGAVLANWWRHSDAVQRVVLPSGRILEEDSVGWWIRTKSAHFKSSRKLLTPQRWRIDRIDEFGVAHGRWLRPGRHAKPWSCPWADLQRRPAYWFRRGTGRPADTIGRDLLAALLALSRFRLPGEIPCPLVVPPLQPVRLHSSAMLSAEAASSSA